MTLNTAQTAMASRRAAALTPLASTAAALPGLSSAGRRVMTSEFQCRLEAVGERRGPIIGKHRIDQLSVDHFGRQPPRGPRCRNRTNSISRSRHQFAVADAPGAGSGPPVASAYTCTRGCGSNDLESRLLAPRLRRRNDGFDLRIGDTMGGLPDRAREIVIGWSGRTRA